MTHLAFPHNMNSSCVSIIARPLHDYLMFLLLFKNCLLFSFFSHQIDLVFLSFLPSLQPPEQNPSSVAPPLNARTPATIYARLRTLLGFLTDYSSFENSYLYYVHLYRLLVR